MNEQEFRELSAGRALGALSPEDETAFADALSAHPHWQSIVDEDQETAALIGLAAPAAEPPADLRERILDLTASAHQQAAGTDAGLPTKIPGPPAASGGHARRGLSRRSAAGGARPRLRVARLFALAASVVLVAGAAVTALTLLNRDDPSPTEAALEQVEAATDVETATASFADGGSAELVWSDSVGKAVVVAEGLPTLKADQTFELWIVRGDEPVSAGLMDARDGASTAVVEGDLRSGDVVAVTVEPEGGSRTGAPTSEPFVAITT